MLDIVASYYFIQFQGELMTQIQENGKKNSHIGPDLCPPLPNSGRESFILKNQTLSVTTYHGQPSFCTILHLLTKGWTDRQMERLTDGRE